MVFRFEIHNKNRGRDDLKSPLPVQCVTITNRPHHIAMKLNQRTPDDATMKHACCCCSWCTNLETRQSSLPLSLCPTCICWLPPECPSICALWLLSRRRWKREAEEEEEGQRIQLYETCNGDQNKHRNQLWEWGCLKAAAGWGVV